MPETSIQFSVRGPDEDQVSKEIAVFFESRFGQRPTVHKARPAGKQDGTKDFVGAATLVAGIVGLFLTIPGAVLASRDLADRMDKKDTLDELIQLAGDLHQQYPDTDVTVKTDRGSVTLHGTRSGVLLNEFDKGGI